jgi:molybdenum cofactor cytidylyltransferase
MGRPKLLLPWGKTTILGHLIKQWQGRGANQLAVVCAAADSTIDAELDRLCFSQENRVRNPNPNLGMFSSIVSAARWSGWKPSLTHWIIVLGDQPHLLPDTLDKLLSFTRKHSTQVCQPVRNGKRRHPVVMPKTVFLALAESRASDLKDFLASQPVAVCECGDPGLELDIDQPEDYQRALALAGLTTR